MSNAPPLSVAFIERNPSAAARVLENLSTDDASALINVLPGYASALALGRMTPFAAAQCVIQLETDRVVLILRTMSFLDAASVLRIMNDENRSAVLDALPEDLARDFKKSLRHPRDSVGAWMNQRISPLPQSRTVADALKYAKRKTRPEGDELFIVDDAHRFVGVIRISRLIQNDSKAVLKDLIKTGAPTISNRATLASIIDSPFWDDHAGLAVVGRKGNFLGTLSHSLARQGIVAAQRNSPGVKSDSILTHLIGGCFVAFVGLLGLILNSAKIQEPITDLETSHDR
ncbi:magnesium transporter MgtE N-terminal domain-containing protein [Sneathiella sp. HT1-7]|uniref:magnesium transporter MgtE N-terminal domain-containing protein n=1 Tax=Sneathiella sp. HT1-7 TaxID=2887192 RepID=UPI001D14F19A|nr:hypothetical protein [Sneathiella sp. HT1-7]MCC3305080.1 hypothetical protein [Sneathiella sp. HT1-7]